MSPMSAKTTLLFPASPKAFFGQGRAKFSKTDTNNQGEKWHSNSR
jgi:hypothetical protein